MRLPTLEEIYWILEFGIPKRKVSFLQLRKDTFKDLFPPVFFLSTGRAGTKWFSEIIKADKSVKVLHNPAPNLAIQNVTAYNFLANQNPSDHEKQLLKELFLAARENHLRYSVKTSRRLIETNNSITFFTPVLYELFPEAKFVHLVRHPIDFIISGMKRNYYTDSAQDLRRPEKKDEKWQAMSRIEKIAWLWNETNEFIETQKQIIGNDQCFTLSFSDFDVSNTSKLLQFIDVKISVSRIKKRIGSPVNTQKKGNAPHFEQWSEDEKLSVIKICGNLAAKYGFGFD